MEQTPQQQKAAAAIAALHRARRAEARDLLTVAKELNADGGPWSGWAGDALCPQIGLHLFNAGAEDRGAFDLARSACALCPVRVECLADALATGETEGIRGGLSMWSLRSGELREVA